MGKVPCCMESGRSSILHVFHPCHDTPLSKSVHLEMMSSLLIKGVLFLNFHPLTWAYFGKHSLPRTATLLVNIAHHIDFATCPALPAGMNPTLCLPHSWSLLHTGHHIISIVQPFNKRIQANTVSITWDMLSSVLWSGVVNPDYASEMLLILMPMPHLLGIMM